MRDNTFIWKYIVVGMATGLYAAALVITLVYAFYYGLAVFVLTAAVLAAARLSVCAGESKSLADFERNLYDSYFRTSKRLLIKTANWFANPRSVVGVWVDDGAGRVAFRLEHKDVAPKICGFSDLRACGVECDFTVMAGPASSRQTSLQPLYTSYCLWIAVNPGALPDGDLLNMRIMPSNSNSMNRSGYKKSQASVKEAVMELRRIIGARRPPGAAGLPSAQPSSEAVLFRQTYKNDEEGFSFYCPDGWKAGANLTASMIIYFYAPPLLNPSASISVSKLRAGHIFDAVKSDFEADLTKRYHEINALGLTDITLDGVPARQLIFTEKSKKGKETAYAQYLYEAGRNAYIVTCVARQSNAGNYFSVFEDIMASYKING